MNDPRRTLPWVDTGTALFLETVAGLSDTDLAAPSGLPGWTRAHVAGHVARNADALGNLVTWARTGVETPAYASPEQRAADIETTARRGCRGCGRGRCGCTASTSTPA